MKSITKRLITTLALCGALVLEAGATAIGSLGKALNHAAEVKAADPAPINTVLWGENFSKYLSSGTLTEKPAESNCTVYGNSKLAYSYSGTSKLYKGTMSAGGDEPELLISSGATFSINNIPTGLAKKISLSFISNKSNFGLTCSDTAYTVSGSGKSWTLTLDTTKTCPDKFNLVLKNNETKNARVDNIELKVTEKGGIADKYNVTYLSNGGTGSSTTNNVSVFDECMFAAPTGKQFVEWNTNADGTGTSYKVGDTVPSIITVYAIWDVLLDGYYKKVTTSSGFTDGKYLIVYDGGSGSSYALNGSLNPIDVTSNTVAVTIGTDGIATSSEVNNAIFTVNAANGSFKGKNGLYIYHKGSSNTLDTSSDEQTNSVTFESNGQANITFSDNYFLRYNTSSGQDRFRYYSTGTPLPYLYRFDDGTGPAPTEKVHITYNANGATGDVPVDDTEYENGASVEILSYGNLTKEHYSFDGWYANAEGTGTKYVVGTTYNFYADTELFAKWKKDTVHLTYDVNGGTGSMSGNYVNYDEDFTVPKISNDVTPPTGKRFSHWNTQSDDKGTKYEVGATIKLTAATTLYAIWETAPDSDKIVFSTLGMENAEEVGTKTTGAASFAFDAGDNSNAPKYYTSGTAVRCYGGNKLTVSSATKKITKISITFASGDGTSNAISSNIQKYTDNVGGIGVWENAEGASSVIFTIGGASGNRRISEIEVEYKSTVVTHEISDSGLSNLTLTADSLNVVDGEDFEGTLAPVTGYNLPDSISVTPDTAFTSYNYVKNTATLTITGVIGDITVTGSGVVKTYNVSTTGLTNITSNGATTVSHNASYTATLTPAVGYNLPDSVTVEGTGITSSDYSFNKATGVLTINANKIQSDISINGTAVIKTYTVNSAGLTNLSVKSAGDVKYHTACTIIIGADVGYELPTTITVKNGADTTLSAGVDYSYNSATGEIVIAKDVISNDIYLVGAGTPSAEPLEPAVVISSDYGATSTNPIEFYKGDSGVATLSYTDATPEDYSAAVLGGSSDVLDISLSNNFESLSASVKNGSSITSELEVSYRITVEITEAELINPSTGQPYGNISVDVYFKVKPAVVSEIVLNPTALSIYQGASDSFSIIVNGHGSFDDKVSVVSSDSTKVTVSASEAGSGDSVTVSANKDATPGNYTITVSGENDVEEALTVTVLEKSIDHISVTTKPTHLNDYKLGDAFNPEGMVVKAFYTNETSDELTADQYTVDVDMYKYSPTEVSISSTVTVTLKNTNLTDTFDITISKEVPVKTTKYVLVEDASKLQAGDEILFYAQKGSDGFVSGDFKEKYLLSARGASVSNKELTLPEEGYQLLKLDKSDGAWTLSIGESKIGTSGAKALSLGSDIATNTWTISITDGVATVASTEESYGRILYNTGSPRFLNYTSATSDTMILPSIYKKVEESSGTEKLVKFDATLKDDSVRVAGVDTVGVSDFDFTGLLNTGEPGSIDTSKVAMISSGNLVAGDNDIEFSYEGLTYRAHCNVKAKALITYSLTVDCNSEQVEYEVDPTITDNKLVEGEDYTITVSAKEGYVIETVTPTGATVSGNVVTITNASSDVSITVTSRALETFNITYDGTNADYATITPKPSTIVEGNDLDLTVTANENKKIDSVVVKMDGVEQTGAYSAGKIHLDNVSGDIEITVNCSYITYEVDFSGSDSNITFNPATESYNQGAEFNVTAQFNDFLYEIDTDNSTYSMEGGGTLSLVGNVFHADAVTGDITISLVLKDVTHEVVLDDDVKGYTISDVTQDATGLTVTLALEDHYASLPSSIECSIEGTTGTKSYTVTDNKIVIPAADITGKVTLSTDAIIDNHSITAGTVTGISFVNASGDYGSDQDIVFSVKPGYKNPAKEEFVIKTNDEGIDFNVTYDEDGYGHITFKLYGDTVISVVAELKDVNVSVPTGVNVSPTSVKYGATQEFEISVAEGYMFTSDPYYTIGEDDTQYTITANKFTVEDITETITVHVDVKEIVSLTQTLDDGITSSVSTDYLDKGQETTIYLTAPTGYDIDMDTLEITIGDLSVKDSVAVYSKSDGKLRITFTGGLLPNEDIVIIAHKTIKVFDVQLEEGYSDKVTLSGDLSVEYDNDATITMTLINSEYYYIEDVTVYGGSHVSVTPDVEGEVEIVIQGVTSEIKLVPVIKHKNIDVTKGAQNNVTIIITTTPHINLPADGSDIEGTIVPATGYLLPSSISVSIDGVIVKPVDEVTGDTIYTYNPTTGDFKIKAIGNIVVSASGTLGKVGYSVTGDDDAYKFDYNQVLVIDTEGKIDSGSIIDINVSAKPGYKVTSVTVEMGGEEITAVFGNRIYILNVTGDVEITVVTEELYHNVSIISYNGYSDGDAINSIKDGESLEVTFVPDTGYHLDYYTFQGTMGGEDISAYYSDGVLSIPAVTGAIEAWFEASPDTFEIATNLGDSTIDSDVTVLEYGEQFSAKVTPNEGYKITLMTVTMGDNPVTVTNYGFSLEATGNVVITVVTEKIVPTVTNTLTHATNSNTTESVDYGTQYVANITADEGYKNLAVRVEMGGVDVTSSYYSNGVIIIPKVTGDIEVIATASIIECNITWNLDHVTSAQSTTTKVNYGSDLEVTLEEGENCFDLTVKVTVNGVPQTVILDEDGKFTLSNITGNVIITASATELVATHIEVSMVDNEITYNTDLDDFIGVIVVELHYNDDSYETISAQSVTGYNKNQLGPQTIEVYAGGFSEYLDIVVVYSDTISSISAKANAESYDFGYALKATDFEVTATYADGHTDTIDAEYIEFDGKAGERTVIVHAAGLTDSVTVIINASTLIESISAKANAESGSYAYGYELQTTDFEVTATYTDGHTAIIDATKVEPSVVEAGLNVVTVTAGGKTCEVVVKVNDSTEVASINAVIKDGKDEVAYKGTFGADDVVVYATYTDGKTKVVTGFTMSGFDGEQLGVNTVTISFGGKTCTVKVTVLASTVVVRIEATTEKTTVDYGVTFTKEDVKVTEVFEDDHRGEAVTPTEITGFTGAVGVNNVTVSYNGKTTVIQITVKPSEVIESITAVVNEGKAELEYGVAFTENDVTVTAKYEDGNTAVVAADSVDFVGTPGENIVVVHVGEKTCNVTVTVKPSEVIASIEASTEKTTVDYGSTFTKEDVKVTYVYEDGHKVEGQAAESVTGFDSKVIGEQTLTVTAAGKETTLKITVNGHVIVSISAVNYNEYVDQGKEYVFNGTVSANYADGSSSVVTEGYTVGKVDTSGHGPQTVKVSYEGFTTDITINVIQTKTDSSPTAMTAIISGSVVGVAVLAVGIFFLLKSFKI